jgi:four helix bundle protein
MPAQPAYKTFELYNLSKKLVVACYELTHDLPAEEKTNLAQYIRTAAVTVHLNIAQGIFLNKKKKKKKPLQTIQNALTIIDAALAVLTEVGYTTGDRASAITALTSAIYQAADSLKKEK